MLNVEEKNFISRNVLYAITGRPLRLWVAFGHYCDVTMGAMASQITSLKIVYSTVIQVQIKEHQSSASLAFVRGINRCPVNSPHKWPVTRKMFPFDDVIMAETTMYQCIVVSAFDDRATVFSEHCH